jgi:cold shock CspA family protein
MKMESEIGTITKWNDEKGFGFITPNSGRKQIFIHINEFSRKHK